MIDKSKKRKKATITEDNMSAVLQRYSVTTVLALLQEVSQAAGEKINWHEMVKNTATGICSAREYQMLWRHLAYSETLIDQIEPDSNPMDDDSDLDYEMEPFPAAGREALVEAAACAKVLISSGYTNDSNLPNNSTASTIEGPLTINIPNSKTLSTPPDSSHFVNVRQGKNITIPVSLQKVPSSSGLSGEKRLGTEAPGVNLPSRRKRRNWSVEEDQKLTAALKNIVEPNWALIASKEFNNDRKPSELSLRWGNLKKKQGNLKSGTTSHVPETQLAAAHRAMSLALDMPMGDNLKTTSAGTKSQQQPQKPSVLPDPPSGRGSGPTKPQGQPKRLPANPAPTPDSMVKAAAVAAGARIASASDASSLLEAARSRNVVHITTGGGPGMRSGPSGLSSQLPSNVHFIRNGLVKAPISTYSPAKPSVSRPVEPQNAQGGPSVKAAAQPNPESSVPKEAAQKSQAGDQADASGSARVEQAVAESQPSVPVNREVEKQVKSAGDQGKKDDGVDEKGSGLEDNSELKC